MRGLYNKKSVINTSLEQFSIEYPKVNAHLLGGYLYKNVSPNVLKNQYDLHTYAFSCASCQLQLFLAFAFQNRTKAKQKAKGCFLISC